MWRGSWQNSGASATSTAPRSGSTRTLLLGCRARTRNGSKHSRRASKTAVWLRPSRSRPSTGSRRSGKCSATKRSSSWCRSRRSRQASAANCCRAAAVRVTKPATTTRTETTGWNLRRKPMTSPSPRTRRPLQEASRCCASSGARPRRRLVRRQRHGARCTGARDRRHARRAGGVDPHRSRPRRHGRGREAFHVRDTDRRAREPGRGARGAGRRSRGRIGLTAGGDGRDCREAGGEVRLLRVPEPAESV